MSIETYTFKNGFKLVYEKTTSAIPVTAILVFVKLGSIHESTLQQKGIAHFIEHMCFKGTNKMRTAKDITINYDKIGAYLNAHTYKEFTVYDVKCVDEYAANCIDVLSDMVLKSVFNPKDVLLERNVVKEEAIRADDDPKQHLSKMTYKLVFGKPYGEPIDDLKYHTGDSLPYDEVLKMYNQFYQPNTMGISIVSSLSFRTIKTMVQSSSFMKKYDCPSLHSISYSIPNLSDIQYDIRTKTGVSATHLAIAFRVCERGNKDEYTLNLLSNIIGGYMSSRMFTLLREKHGLTYKSTCHVSTYKPAGKIEFYTLCDHTQMMKNKENVGVLKLVIQLINELIKHGITQKELDATKGYYKGWFISSMENIKNQCQYNGIELLAYDNPQCCPYKDIYKTYYDKITKKDVNAAIRKYFTRDTMCVCLIGENVPTLDAVKKCCDSFIHP